MFCAMPSAALAITNLVNTEIISIDSEANPALNVDAGSSITNSGSILNTNGNSTAVRITSTGGTSTSTIINTGTIKGASNGTTQIFIPGTNGSPGQQVVGADTSIDASGLIATEAVNITNSGSLNYFYTGAGNDSFTQTAGSASGEFGDGNNSITLSGGQFSFFSGTGNDTLTMDGGTLTQAMLNDGDNTVYLTSGTVTNAVIWAGSGINDKLFIGRTGSSSTLNASSIAGFDTVEFVAGTTHVFSSSFNLFVDASSVTLRTGATIDVGNRDVLFAGGAYIQQAGGMLRATFDNATQPWTAGKLELLGFQNGIFAEGSIIHVDVAPLNSTDFNLTTIDGDAFTVFDGGDALAGTAIVAGSPTGIIITSSNPLIQFHASINDNGNDILLTADAIADAASISSNLLASTRAGTISPNALAGALGGGANASNGSATQQSFGSFLAGLSSSNTQQFNTVLNAFSNLGSTQEVANALTDLQIDSALTSGSTQALNASSSAQQGVVVGQLQQARTQLANAEYGASAGNDFGSDLRLWAQPFAAQFNQQAHDGFEGFDASSYGVLIGGDVAAHEAMRVGAALNYSTTNVTGDGNNAQNGSDIEGYGIMLYGTYTPRQNLFFDGMLGASFNRYDASRFVAFLGERAKADYNGHQLSARLGVGYDIPQAGFIITPSSYFSTTRTQQDSFTETGSTVRLRVAEQTTTRSETGIGLKAAYPMKQRDGTFTPSLRVGASRAFGSQSQSSTQNFAAGGAAFTTRGAESDRHAISSGIGLNYEALNGTVLTLDGNYEHHNTSDGISGFLRINAPF
jgi:outer membrane autotransporter protein